MKRRENDLGKDSVGTLLFRLAVPAIAAQLVNALYNIVDRMYIGHIPDVGSLSLTGLGICYPILLVISALSVLSSSGGGSRASVRMGEGQVEEANKILGGCVAMLLTFSVVTTLSFQIFKEPLLFLFGASENTIGYATDYLGIYLWGTVFVMGTLGLNNFISIQGFSTISMLSTILGAVVNIILDPIFIFALDMGVRGAALATVLAQMCSAIWIFRFLRGKRTKLTIQRRYIRLDSTVLIPVVSLGVSPFIMQATNSLVNITLNASLSQYGGDLAVGAMTICSSVMQVFHMPVQGFSQGAQPIIGFNFGAGNFDRVRRTFRILVVCCLTCSTLGWVAVHAAPQFFVSIFNDTPDLVEITLWTLPLYMGGSLVFGAQTACQQTFVALGEAKISLFLALLRKVILLIPLVLILPRVMGYNEVFFTFLSQPIADILAAATTATIFAYRFPKLLKRREVLLREQNKLPK